MSSEEAQPARILEESDFDNDITSASGTVYVRIYFLNLFLVANLLIPI
jgi:hypothetical protein